MSRERATGFTVIETMLFLAVSGLLVLGILFGAGTAVNAQRYKDAGHSLISYFQGEYDRVARVQNDRPESLICNADTQTIASADTGTAALGTTDCLLIGRLLTLDGTTGKTITSEPVFASEDVSILSSGSDTAAIQASDIFLDTGDSMRSRYTPEWDTKIVKTGTTDAAGWRLLIVRSPSSGSIKTFATDTSSGSVSDMVNDAYRTELRMCLDSQGLINFERKGVVITKDASGAAGVKEIAGGAC